MSTIITVAKPTAEEQWRNQMEALRQCHPDMLAKMTNEEKSSPETFYKALARVSSERAGIKECHKIMGPTGCTGPAGNYAMGPTGCTQCM